MVLKIQYNICNVILQVQCPFPLPALARVLVLSTWMTCSAIVEKQDLLTAPTEELVFITVHTLKMLVSDVYVSCKSLGKKIAREI